MNRRVVPALLSAAFLTAAPLAAQQLQPQPPQATLVQRDANGRIVRLDGVIDAWALLKSPAIDEVTRQNMVPWVAEWTADINQSAIDNLDFVEKIDEGLIDTFKNTDLARAKYIQQMFTQFTAHGTLSARLQQRGVLSFQQAQAVQQLSAGYTQNVYAELSQGMRDPATQAAAQDEISRFFYYVSARDVRAMYHKQVVDAAGMLDQIMPSLGLSAEALKKLEPAVAAVKAAKTDAEKLNTGRDLLKGLSFDQRRAFLSKAVALGAAADPFKPAPTPPPVVAPSPAAAATPAAKPSGN